ncbi:MAG: AAA-like domain-containing protein [Lachnospiraceae bacterium]|nr:AAA-like domain-containing protein [Lachnospiraceae bacterium]
MAKIFNTNGICLPDRHYMVDLNSRLAAVKEMVDAGDYFTINRARQYGKTTILNALAGYLKPYYFVISLDFQGLSYTDFESEERFVAAVSRQILLVAEEELIAAAEQELRQYADEHLEGASLSRFFFSLTGLCKKASKRVVLLIDEVDSASNNQVFLDFLAQLRFYYLKRPGVETFQSVILAGVYDVKNLKQKIHPEAESRYNSPWNIAVDFTVDMSFSPKDITSMLTQYDADWDTGMDMDRMSCLLYDYTMGYPFLVSRLCQIMAKGVTEHSTKSEKKESWGEEAFQRAVRVILKTPNTLFDDMSKKLADYPKLKEMIYGILFQGRKYSYEAENERIRIGEMFGFLKEKDGIVCVSNRIFEMKLYNLFLSEEETDFKIFTTAEMEKNQFVLGGHLQMELVLKKFCEYFEDIYADADERFIEENGRRIFLIFLKPIINGSGNYYIEARTRNLKRTDVIIDYKGVQEVLEMKIWHGQEYNRRGEQQLLEYMDYYHLQKGYMLSFNFNKKKEIGIRQLQLGERTLIEAVV